MLLLLNVGILLDNGNATVLLNVCCYFSMLLMLLYFLMLLLFHVATFSCCIIRACAYTSAHAHLVGLGKWSPTDLERT